MWLTWSPITSIMEQSFRNPAPHPIRAARATIRSGSNSSGRLSSALSAYSSHRGWPSWTNSKTARSGPDAQVRPPTGSAATSKVSTGSRWVQHRPPGHHTGGASAATDQPTVMATPVRCNAKPCERRRGTSPNRPGSSSISRLALCASRRSGTSVRLDTAIQPAFLS